MTKHQGKIKNNSALYHIVVRMTFITMLISSVAIVFVLCKRGIWEGADSLGYYRYPISGVWSDLPVRYGILYPMLLRFVVKCLDVGVSQAAIFYNVFMYGLFSLVVNFIIFIRKPEKCSELYIQCLGSAMVIFGIPILMAFSSALSESTFMVFILWSVLLLVRGLSGNSTSLLILSALFASGGCLTRFAGVSWVVAACGSLVLLRGFTLKQKIIRAILYGCVSFIPLLLFLAWNRFRSGSATGMRMTWKIIPYEQLNEGFVSMASWYFPYKMIMNNGWLPPLISLIIAIVIMYVTAVSWNKHHINRFVFGLFSIVYVAFIAYSTCSLREIMLNQRILIPLYTSVMILTIDICCSTWKNKGQRILISGFIIYMTFFTSYRAIGFISSSFKEGLGFSSREWKSNPAMKIAQLINSTVPDIVIYSNASDALYFWGIPDVIGIPWRLDQASHGLMPGYERQQDKVIDDFINNNAVLVYVSLRYWPDYLMSKSDLICTGELELLAYLDDEAIYINNNNKNKQQIVQTIEDYNRSADGNQKFQLISHHEESKEIFNDVTETISIVTKRE